MKLVDLVRHLEKSGCQELRQGRGHTMWENPVTQGLTAVPRHREILPSTVRKICKDLGIPKPPSLN